MEGAPRIAVWVLVACLSWVVLVQAIAFTLLLLFHPLGLEGGQSTDRVVFISGALAAFIAGVVGWVITDWV